MGSKLNRAYESLGFFDQASQIGRMNRTNMPDEYMLSAKAWAAIEPLLPEVYAGARRHDDAPVKPRRRV
jgi:hypothetical protein